MLKTDRALAWQLAQWHESRVRVRFEETDLLGVVYYAKFFVWMEVGRINLLRDVGLAYRDWEKEGLGMPVVRAHADYKAPARFDDEILVKTKVASVGNTSIKFDNEIYKLPQMHLLCTGHTVHTLIGKDGKPVPFPTEAKKTLTSS